MMGNRGGEKIPTPIERRSPDYPYDLVITVFREVKCLWDFDEGKTQHLRPIESIFVCEYLSHTAEGVIKCRDSKWVEFEIYPFFSMSDSQVLSMLLPSLSTGKLIAIQNANRSYWHQIIPIFIEDEKHITIFDGNEEHFATALSTIFFRQGGRYENCEWCSTRLEKPLRCAACQYVIYCSRACQKQAWKGHKPYCKCFPEIRELEWRISEKIPFVDTSKYTWCGICSTNGFRDLRQHFITSHREKYCILCDAYFLEERWFQSHLFLHREALKEATPSIESIKLGSLESHQKTANISAKTKRDKVVQNAQSATKQSTPRSKLSHTPVPKTNAKKTKGQADKDRKGRFQCTLCGRNHESQEQLYAHTQRHKKKDHNFGCKICEKAFKAEKDYIKHVQMKHDKTHQNTKPVKVHNIVTPMAKSTVKADLETRTEAQYISNCEQCGQICYSKDDLETHIICFHHAFKCFNCEESFKTAISRDSHWITVHRDRECDVCGSIFNSDIERDKHRFNEHERLTCPICSEAFESSESLDAHFIKHSPDEVRKVTFQVRLL